MNDDLSKFGERWVNATRFAVEGPDGRFSTGWRVKRSKDDIYIFGRTIGQALKISLHPGGDYRLALDGNFYRKVRDRLAGRLLISWPRPSLDGIAAAEVLGICFPIDHLASGRPAAASTSPYVLFDGNSPGDAVYVLFFLSKLPAQELEPLLRTRGSPMIRWELSDGTNISMVVHVGDFDRGLIPLNRLPRSVIPMTATGTIDDHHYKTPLTMMIWDQPAPGAPLRVIEVGGVTLNADGSCSLRQL